MQLFIFPLNLWNKHKTLTMWFIYYTKHWPWLFNIYFRFIAANTFNFNGIESYVFYVVWGNCGNTSCYTKPPDLNLCPRGDWYSHNDFVSFFLLLLCWCLPLKVDLSAVNEYMYRSIERFPRVSSRQWESLLLNSAQTLFITYRNRSVGPVETKLKGFAQAFCFV